MLLGSNGCFKMILYREMTLIKYRKVSHSILTKMAPELCLE